MDELHQDPFIDDSIWLQHCLKARVRRVLFARKEEEGEGEQQKDGEEGRKAKGGIRVGREERTSSMH